MKYFFHKVHLWLSIPLGFFIIIICFSGCILVFQDNIEEWCDPYKYFNQEREAKPLPIGKLIKIIDSQLDNNSVNSIEIPSDSKRNYIMRLEKGARASVYVNPYTAEITGKSERGEGFFSIILRLHRWLLGGKDSIGQSIVGYTTLLLVIIIITGIIIWWPKSRKQLKKQIQIKTKYGLKRFLVDLHVSGGAYLLMGLLVLSLTGLYFSFEWYRKGVAGILGIEMKDYRTQNNQFSDKSKQQKGKHAGHSSEGNTHKRGGSPNYWKNNKDSENIGNQPKKNANQETGQKPWYKEENGSSNQNEQSSSNDSISNRISKHDIFSSWQGVFESLKNKQNSFKSISIQNGLASVSLDFTFGNARAADKYTFNNETGVITKVEPYENQDGIIKLHGWVYSLHTGKWGGIFSKILTCIISLLGGILPITGYYIFIVKRKKKNKTKHVIKHPN